jgi:hypothetical protein
MRKIGGLTVGGPDLVAQVVMQQQDFGVACLLARDFLAAGTDIVWLIRPWTIAGSCVRGAARYGNAMISTLGSDLISSLRRGDRNRLWRDGGRNSFANTVPDSAGRGYLK